MPPNKKITEFDLLSRLQEREDLLAPMRIRKVVEQVGVPQPGYDAHIVAYLPDSSEEFRFLVEAKSGSTPQIVHGAIAQVRASLRSDGHPMILVPYLSPHNLELLEREAISGIDLCGNGIVTIPGRVMIFRTGNKNLYPDSRALINPFRGRSAMVARALLSDPNYNSLGQLHDRIEEGGVKLSLSQVSKAVKALEEEMLVATSGRSIILKDPLRLLDKLGAEWRTPRSATMSIRLPDGDRQALVQLSNDANFDWAIAGESSVDRYTPFGQGGPLRVIVSDLRRAVELLEGQPEHVPKFADVELVETKHPGYYFETDRDADGIRWASLLQVWVELQGGDGRQQDVARTIREQVLERMG